MTHPVQKGLDALSVHLMHRREALLRAWREAVRRDPELTTSASLSRGALDDHIPRILEDFARRLRAEHALDATQLDLEQRRDAAEHGMHRWQQGYDIRETMREWGHLQAAVMDELDDYAASHPQLERQALRAARNVLGMLCMEGNCESATRHVRLQQAEAASRMRDLEASLSALQALEDERAKLLREAAHDLRGSIGVIANTTALLASNGMSGPQRDRFSTLLQRRIRSTGALLTELIELARLEAGQDPLAIEPFDAAERVREWCDLLRPLATERNLFLKCEGPTPLRVDGDPAKLQRIVQNLLLNALKVTRSGGIVVRWHAGAGEGARHWTLSVQDTGPGFEPRAAGPLREAWRHGAADAREAPPPAAPHDRGVARGRPERAASEPRAGSAAALPSGEGIGLWIVKRLCDVLGARVELDSAPGRGSTIRIDFPRHYAPGGASVKGEAAPDPP